MSWMSPFTVPITILPIFGAPVSAKQRTQDEHARLHGVGGEQHLRHEQDAVAEILADDAHALDQRLGQHVVGRPAALEQDLDALLDLLLQAVIEVVVHLRDEVVVGERCKIDIVVGHQAGSATKAPQLGGGSAPYTLQASAQTPSEATRPRGLRLAPVRSGLSAARASHCKRAVTSRA